MKTNANIYVKLDLNVKLDTKIHPKQITCTELAAHLNKGATLLRS